MPMRKGYADKVFIITSGENMAIHAGANIAMAVENFQESWICFPWRDYSEPQEMLREKKKRYMSWQMIFRHR